MLKLPPSLLTTRASFTLLLKSKLEIPKPKKCTPGGVFKPWLWKFHYFRPSLGYGDTDFGVLSFWFIPVLWFSLPYGVLNWKICGFKLLTDKFLLKGSNSFWVTSANFYTCVSFIGLVKLPHPKYPITESLSQCMY